MFKNYVSIAVSIIKKHKAFSITLDALVKKGYVVTRKGEPVSQRGGQNKVYYSLTGEGMLALQRARELQESLWVGMPKILYSDTG